jgi:uncharacterized protein (TIGR02118 family)
MTTFKLLILAIALGCLASCSSTKHQNHLPPETGLFKVMILYPSGEGKTFDMEYYEKKHMPFVAVFLGKNLRFYEIDKGISGRTPADPLPFVAIGYFYCFDVAEYNKAIGQNITAIREDIKKYTNIQPIIQISEVRQVGGKK